VVENPWSYAPGTPVVGYPDTPCGEILKEIIGAGGCLGVSKRLDSLLVLDDLLFFARGILGVSMVNINRYNHNNNIQCQSQPSLEKAIVFAGTAVIILAAILCYCPPALLPSLFLSSFAVTSVLLTAQNRTTKEQETSVVKEKRRTYLL